ncbi:GntR family transcriptional regulator [Nocardia testacea]|uniref:GntR family transcriptional regulator n=1 Tax=Nocardia testacea TaxID=248551 RepID=A0ABW7VTJ0_9NOCA
MVLSTRTSPTALAMRVIELIRERELEVGAHLSEQWVADSLRISRTPARKALSFMADIGLVEQLPRRGFHLKMSAAELSKVAFTTDAGDDEQVYFRIVDDHLGGRFTGEFATTELCRRYGLSTRQANLVLARLEAEDLIRRHPGRGWEFQRSLTSAEAHNQSYRFRLMVEPAALLEPGFTIDPAAFALHRKQQESMLHGNIVFLSRTELFRYGSEFHEMIVDCAHNAFLSDALKRVNRMRRLIEYNHQADRSRLVTQAREHLQLLDLLEAGRNEEASRFLRDHLDTVRALKTGMHH